MKIILNPKSAYGRMIYYPACELSHMLCELLRRKSLAAADVKIMKKYGIQIQGEK